jgi:hypothetical protein
MAPTKHSPKRRYGAGKKASPKRGRKASPKRGRKASPKRRKASPKRRKASPKRSRKASPKRRRTPLQAARRRFTRAEREKLILQNPLKSRKVINRAVNKAWRESPERKELMEKRDNKKHHKSLSSGLSRGRRAQIKFVRDMKDQLRAEYPRAKDSTLNKRALAAWKRSDERKAVILGQKMPSSGGVKASPALKRLVSNMPARVEENQKKMEAAQVIASNLKRMMAEKKRRAAQSGQVMSAEDNQLMKQMQKTVDDLEAKIKKLQKKHDDCSKHMAKCRPALSKCEREHEQAKRELRACRNKDSALMQNLRSNNVSRLSNEQGDALANLFEE